MPRSQFAGDPRLAVYHAEAGPTGRSAIGNIRREVVASRARFSVATFAKYYRECFPSRDTALSAVDHAVEQAEHWVTDCGDAHAAAREYLTRLRTVRAMIAEGG